MVIVALLAEGVDRNDGDRGEAAQIQVSPSSRRAWIEIQSVRDLIIRQMVALLAEGVDRNLGSVRPSKTQYRRPPRGGRG